MSVPLINPLLKVYTAAGRALLGPMLRRESRRPPFDKINERPIEFGFALKWLAQLCPKTVLDVGAGVGAWPSIMAQCGFRVTAIDKIRGYWKDWPGGFFNRHFLVRHDDITNPSLDRTFDLVTCISVLEHIPEHRAAIAGMIRLLNPGGHLVLTVPYNEASYVPDAYRLPNAGYGRDRKYICQIYSRAEVDDWIGANPMELVEQEYHEVFTGDLWTVGERMYPPRRVEHGEKSHLTCLLFKKTPDA